METKNWKWFRYDEIFEIHTFKGENILNSHKGKVPYVSSSALNNGISTFVESDYFEPANKITVARNGSVCCAFYQSKNFCASPDDIRIFKLRSHELTPELALFLCTTIEKEKYRYAYGRKFGTERMKQQTIKLPIDKNNNPDWQWIENYVKEKLLPELPQKAKNVWLHSFDTAPFSTEKKELDTKNWQWFRYDEIFEIEKGFYNKKPDENSNGNIPFIGATDANNGITSMHDIETIRLSSKTGDEPNAPIEEKLFQPNCITVSNNGSIGYAFYQPKRFTCTHDVNPLYLKRHELNIYIAMFLCSLIEKEQFRWAYGRKWRPIRMPNSLIKLPVNNNGAPDFQFMEDYIKSLPYSRCL